MIKKDIQHEDYKNTLFNNKQMYHTMKTIRSVHHQLASYELNRVSLSCLDDKRFIHDNGITSYAYGHYKIQNNMSKLEEDFMVNLRVNFRTNFTPKNYIQHMIG